MRDRSFGGRSLEVYLLFLFSFSSLRKIKAIISPIITAKYSPIMRAIPISVPQMLQVRMIESMLMAGPGIEIDCRSSPHPFVDTCK